MAGLVPATQKHCPWWARAAAPQSIPHCRRIWVAGTSPAMTTALGESPPGRFRFAAQDGERLLRERRRAVDRLAALGGGVAGQDTAVDALADGRQAEDAEGHV